MLDVQDAGPGEVVGYRVQVWLALVLLVSEDRRGMCVCLDTLVAVYGIPGCDRKANAEDLLCDICRRWRASGRAGLCTEAEGAERVVAREG